jgi:DNA-binding Xre family transcriptional regulator
MDMRIKITELLKAKGWTWYQLAQESDRQISPSAAYRLVEKNGEIKRFDAKLLDALCDTFGIKDMNDLLERDKKKSRR